MNKIPNGFNLPLIIVALVVGGLVFVGWRWFGDQLRPDGQAQVNAIKTDANEGYIVIEEWGVRFKPTDGLTGIEYFKPKNISADLVSFTTSELAAKEPRCSKDNGSIVMGGLTRTKDPQSSGGGVIAVIDGYSYQYRASGAACSETNEGLALESKVASQLSASIKTLEVAQ